MTKIPTKTNRRKGDDRIIALEVAVEANKIALEEHRKILDKIDGNQEKLTKAMKPFTNAGIAVQWLSRVILWTTGIATSLMSTVYLWGKLKGS